MPFDFGDVVLVRFPFTNQVGSKQRPGVVVSNRRYNTTRPDVILMAITSQLRESRTVGEIWIGDWQAANLLKPSAVKPILATITQELILRSLGTLTEADRGKLRDAITSILG